MTFPNIHPVELGRDGWSVLYCDETSRLLFLCGLRAEANVVNGSRITKRWGVGPKGVVRENVKTAQWDTPLIKPTLEGVRGALRSLERLRGKAMVAAILHRYGAKSPADLGKQWYGTVYDSAQRYIRETA